MAGRRRISWLLSFREILRSAQNDDEEFPHKDDPDSLISHYLTAKCLIHIVG